MAVFFCTGHSMHLYSVITSLYCRNYICSYSIIVLYNPVFLFHLNDSSLTVRLMLTHTAASQLKPLTGQTQGGFHVKASQETLHTLSQRFKSRLFIRNTPTT